MAMSVPLIESNEVLTAYQVFLSRTWQYLEPFFV